MACFQAVLFASMLLAKPIQSLICVTCNEVTSNHECNLMGTTGRCASLQSSCFSEIRIHGGVYSIRKGCMQARSCKVQASENSLPSSYVDRQYGYSERCNSGYDNSVCHYCCEHDYCNVAEKPSLTDRNRSCLQFFPPCRNPEWNERNGFLPPQGRGVSCHCDTLCEMNGDCCSDYRDVCVGVLPKVLRANDPFGGATGGEYTNIIPRGGGLPLLRCFVCEETSSNEECNKIGKIVECQPNQRSCVTEVRIRHGKRKLSKRCEQKRACRSLQRSSPTCVDGDVCFSCCDTNYCNVFERPHERNLTSSCLNAFPGYPQCKRLSLATCEEGDARCASIGCKCDSDCKRFRDCCPDYDELCSNKKCDVENSADEKKTWINAVFSNARGKCIRANACFWEPLSVKIMIIQRSLVKTAPETNNLRWIFREIARNKRRMGISTEGGNSVEGNSDPTFQFREGVPSFTILQDFPTEIELTPLLISEMTKEKEERVMIFKEKWGRSNERKYPHLRKFAPATKQAMVTQVRKSLNTKSLKKNNSITR